jgi:hypothetical protein
VHPWLLPKFSILSSIHACEVYLQEAKMSVSFVDIFLGYVFICVLGTVIEKLLTTIGKMGWFEDLELSSKLTALLRWLVISSVDIWTQVKAVATKTMSMLQRMVRGLEWMCFMCFGFVYSGVLWVFAKVSACLYMVACCIPKQKLAVDKVKNLAIEKVEKSLDVVIDMRYEKVDYIVINVSKLVPDISMEKDR